MTAMDNDRAPMVWAAIWDLARAECRQVGSRHVCEAGAAVVHADGVALYLLGDYGVGEPVHATGEVCEQIADFQVTVGEGPGVDALDESCPVLVPQLTDGLSTRRWPVFAPLVVEAGMSAVFAFPLVHGEIRLGVLEFYRRTEGMLSDGELSDALLFAEAASELIVEYAGDIPTSDEIMTRWTQIHVAIAVAAAQLECDPSQAFLRLRARAFVTDRRLSEIAADVVTRRVRFVPDDDDGQPVTSD